MLLLVGRRFIFFTQRSPPKLPSEVRAPEASREKSPLLRIAALPAAVLSEDLQGHARATGNRDHLRSHEVCAHTGSHQIVPRGQR
jgi:hypothetical protein